VPIYEYGCENCGTIEVTQRITDKPLRRCPTCKGKVSKLISATSFQLKGSGWYVTDYAGKDAKKGKDEGKPESKSESKSESTPASKETKDSSSSSSKADGKTEATAA
jgi:putative FmdB family regulatory protein